MIARRHLLQAALLVPAWTMGGAQLLAAPAGGFTHSVASGDPGTDRVILWTRFVPADGGSARLKVEVSADERFENLIRRGEAVAHPTADHCAHAAVDGLEPGRWYFYRFVAPDGRRSPAGRTRTLPAKGVERLRIAVVGCANATSGWFNAYAHAAARDDLDLVVHTGDYIYESPIDRSDALAELAAARGIVPAGEAVTLADYRLRYGSYRSDPALQELHRRHPMIVIWDDHEIANNSWRDGAKGHRPEDGSWTVRKAAGIRAFREWLPMTASDYAAYQIGDLATIFRLETRLLARNQQLDLAAVAASTQPQAALAAFAKGPLLDPARTLMGARQERWLADGLVASVRSGTRWQVLAQQVVMGASRMPKVSSEWYGPGQQATRREEAELRLAELATQAGVPTALDRWVGYPAARQRLLDSAVRAKSDLVVLSGDSHNAWAYDLDSHSRPAGVEFAGHSVSSLGIDKRFGGDPAAVARDYLQRNPELRWCDTSRRGYMVVELTREAARCEWLFLPSREVRSTTVLDRHYEVAEHGARRLSSAG